MKRKCPIKIQIPLESKLLTEGRELSLEGRMYWPEWSRFYPETCGHEARTGQVRV